MKILRVEFVYTEQIYVPIQVKEILHSTRVLKGYLRMIVNQEYFREAQSLFGTEESLKSSYIL